MEDVPDVVQLFISHSERDVNLVEPVYFWFRDALGLTNDEIRCTSLFNMDAGGIPAAVLRNELKSAKAVIGLITANSLRSYWVQLEFGAGWLEERLQPIRGPGISASDLPSPLSDLVTVGYCEKGGMTGLLHQLASLLDKEVDTEAEKEIDNIAQIGREMLAEYMVSWFSLPPVLSASRLENIRYEYQLQSLSKQLERSASELCTCTDSTGVLIRDPDQLPAWAKDLWTVSKNAVNFMLSPAGKSGPLPDVPSGVLNEELIAKMKQALFAKKGREILVQKWFEEASKWISENPPSERRTHGPMRHH